jgi:SAM-dependent methyltransferase
VNNRDSFDIGAGDYSLHRPGYPSELYEYLAAAAPSNDCAWDCACGNGQVARDLAPRFRRVLARDISANQISRAPRIGNIEYSVGSAEDSGYADASVDLICVAQALHWFDLPAFFDECRRVLKPRGVLAVWGYGFMRIAPAVDELLAAHLYPLLDGYWSSGNRLLWNKYRDVAFPFEPMVAPAFTMSVRWTREQFLKYVGTWSGAVRYREDTGTDPAEILGHFLKPVWPDGEIMSVAYEFTSHFQRRDPGNG